MDDNGRAQLSRHRSFLPPVTSDAPGLSRVSLEKKKKNALGDWLEAEAQGLGVF